MVTVPITMAGFVTQFVGLRALHWSATLITLGLTIVMVAVRAWVRRGLAIGTNYMKLESGLEPVALSLWICDYMFESSSNELCNLILPKSKYARQIMRSTPRTITGHLWQSQRLSCGQSSATSLTGFSPPLSHISATDYANTSLTRNLVQLCLALESDRKRDEKLENYCKELIRVIESLTEHFSTSTVLKWDRSKSTTVTWDLDMIHLRSSTTCTNRAPRYLPLRYRLTVSGPAEDRTVTPWELDSAWKLDSQSCKPWSVHDIFRTIIESHTLAEQEIYGKL